MEDFSPLDSGRLIQRGEKASYISSINRAAKSIVLWSRMFAIVGLIAMLLMHGLSWIGLSEINSSYEWQREWRPDYWLYPELYIVLFFMVFSVFGILLCIYTLIMSGSMSLNVNSSVDKVITGQRKFWQRAGWLFLTTVLFSVGMLITFIFVVIMETRRMNDWVEEEWAEPVEAWDEDISFDDFEDFDEALGIEEDIDFPEPPPPPDRILELDPETE